MLGRNEIRISEKEIRTCQLPTPDLIIVPPYLPSPIREAEGGIERRRHIRQLHINNSQKCQKWVQRTKSGLGCGQDDDEVYGSDIGGKEDDVHGDGKSSGQDDGEHGDVDCESSDSGDDADADGESSGSGDDAEGIEYKWFEGVAKKVAFTHSACDDFCRNTAIHGGEDVEITSEEIEVHGAIECNICNWVWHLGCLNPPITVEQCASNAFFACSPECVKEVSREIVNPSKKG